MLGAKKMLKIFWLVWKNVQRNVLQNLLNMPAKWQKWLDSLVI